MYGGRIYDVACLLGTNRLIDLESIAATYCISMAVSATSGEEAIHETFALLVCFPLACRLDFLNDLRQCGGSARLKTIRDGLNCGPKKVSNTIRG